MRFLSFASAAFLVLSGCSKKKAEVPQSNQVVEQSPLVDGPKTTQFRTSTQNATEDLSSKGNGSSDETTKGEATSSGPMKKRKGEVSSNESLEEETLSVESEATESDESVESVSAKKKSPVSLDEIHETVPAKKKTPVSLDEVHVLGRAGAAHSAVEKEAQLAEIESQLQVLWATLKQDLARLEAVNEETKARTLGAIQAEIVNFEGELKQAQEKRQFLLDAPFENDEELEDQLAELRQLRETVIPQLNMALGDLAQGYHETEEQLEESSAQTRQEIMRKYLRERYELEAGQDELTRLPEGSVVGRAPWVL